jgi:hypothetical protein
MSDSHIVPVYNILHTCSVLLLVIWAVMLCGLVDQHRHLHHYENLKSHTGDPHLIT